MSIGKSFYDQRGRVYLDQPMVAYVYKGRLALRKRPEKYREWNTPLTARRRVQFGFLGRTWIMLSEKERCAWEGYAEMVYDVGARDRQDVTGGCGGIIPRRRMPATGKGAFMQGNLLLHSIGLQEEGMISDIAKKAPLNTGFPSAPMNVSLAYQNGIAEVKWLDPVIDSDGSMPTIKKVRIWAKINAGRRGYGQIVDVVDMPAISNGVMRRFTFDSIRRGVGNKVFSIRLAEMPHGMLHIQLDTVIAVAEGVGAVRSVGSNVDRKPVVNIG